MREDVIVVGAGVWGAASVDAAMMAGRSVLWVSDDDEEHPTAASADIARIVRAAYSDAAYRELAQKCLAAFKTDPRYSKYFHLSGWFLVQDERQAKCGSISGGTERVSIEEFRQKFPAASVDDRLLITRTEDVGWVEANNLLQESMRATNTEGRVQTRKATVTSLILDGSSCRGVRLKTEDVLGNMVILATGWRVNGFLASHNFPVLDYQVVGVPVLGIRLTDEQYSKYRDMPILCHAGKGNSAFP
jgi:sarcosine oxidase/L-pipecolate oxidase